MAVVVADTGPPHYLLLVEQIGLLPELFGRVTVPTSVHAELLHPGAPALVRRWAASPSAWLTVAPASAPDDPVFGRLDDGEAAAIALALDTGADLVLMDDCAGVAIAREKGLTVIGTIGILDLAAGRDLIDIAAVVARLKSTNFRYRPALPDELTSRHRGGAKP